KVISGAGAPSCTVRAAAAGLGGAGKGPASRASPTSPRAFAQPAERGRRSTARRAARRRGNRSNNEAFRIMDASRGNGGLRSPRGDVHHRRGDGGEAAAVRGGVRDRVLLRRSRGVADGE